MQSQGKYFKDTKFQVSESTLGSTEYDRNGPCRLLGDYMVHVGHPLVSGTKCRRLLFARFVTHSGTLLMQVAGLYEALAHSHRPKFSHFPENTGSYLRVTTIHIFIKYGQYIVKHNSIIDFINHLTPNGHFSGPTAPLTYRCCIFYLFNKYTY